MPARDPSRHTTSHYERNNATNPCDDIMSFPGMGGGLPGMTGGAGGNVDPNDPNAVQMVRGTPMEEQTARPWAGWRWSRRTLTWGVHSKKQ